MEARAYWLQTMLKIADPVLKNLAAGTLKQNMPMVFHPDRAEYMHLEALGRTVCGIAPWLELDGLTGEEAEIQAEYRELTRKAIANAVNPESPDFMNFTEGYGQALVDAAFLAHGIVRAPKQLFRALDEQTKRNLVGALRATRKFTPFVMNWLFFSAMVEAALRVMGESDYDLTRVDYAVNMFESWYLGDGVYGDGPKFRWDYYNSFVIQPMYVDVLRTFADVGRGYDELLKQVEHRAGRYAAELEKNINRVKKTAGELLRKNGREPTVEEIAVQLDLEPDRVRELLQLAQDPISLETPVGEEEDAHLEDFIQDEEAGVPVDEAGRQLLRRELMNVLKSLTPREERVIALRFGLEDGRSRTLEELGREFNVTRERVRQIEAKALRKLRHPSRAKRLRDYLDE